MCINDPEDKRAVWLIMLILSSAITVALLCGCKQAEYVSVPVVHTEYIHSTDSFIQRDSVWRDRLIYTKGDTVYNTVYEYKYRDRQILKTDTVLKLDSIPYPVEVEKIVEVKKDLNWWQKLRQWLGGAMIMAAVGAGVIWYLKKRFKSW